MSKILAALILCLPINVPEKPKNICSANGVYKEGPYTGKRGGCYCTNPKNGRKKYIDKRYCTNS